MKLLRITVPALFLFATLLSLADIPFDAERKKALKLYEQGNYLEALETFKTLVASPENDPNAVASDLVYAVQSLQNLNRDGRVVEHLASVGNAGNRTAEPFEIPDATVAQTVGLRDIDKRPCIAPCRDFGNCRRHRENPFPSSGTRQCMPVDIIMRRYRSAA